MLIGENEDAQNLFELIETAFILVRVLRMVVDLQADPNTFANRALVPVASDQHKQDLC